MYAGCLDDAQEGTREGTQPYRTRVHSAPLAVCVAGVVFLCYLRRRVVLFSLMTLPDMGAGGANGMTIPGLTHVVAPAGPPSFA